MTQKRYKIYALCAEDEPLQVRYVGATKRTLEKRLYFHQHSPTNPQMVKWFEDVERRGSHVRIRGLSEHSNAIELSEAEKKWIDFWSNYCDLLNTNRRGYKNDALVTRWMQLVIDAAKNESFNGPLHRRCSEILNQKFGNEIALEIQKENGLS